MIKHTLIPGQKKLFIGAKEGERKKEIQRQKEFERKIRLVSNALECLP